MSDELIARAQHEIAEDRRVAALCKQQHSRNAMNQRADVTAELVTEIEKLRAAMKTIKRKAEIGLSQTSVPSDERMIDGPAEYDYDDQVGLDWVIVGGESGRGARPMHPWWAESLQQQCENADVPYLFKQWGEWTPLAHLVDGKFDFSGGIVMTDDGITYNHGDLYYPDGPRRGEAYRRDFPHHRPTSMYRLGKKRAGRELYHDGRTWDQYPEVSGV